MIKNNKLIDKKVLNQLLNNKTSLGDNPCFPLGDEYNFLSKLVLNRFDEIVNNCITIFDTDNIDDGIIIDSILPLVNETVDIESEDVNELVDIAIKSIKEKFDIDDEIDISGELTDEINSLDLNDVPTNDVKIEFEDHQEMEYTINSIYKRRFINSLIEGSNIEVYDVLKDIENEIININPRLINYYKKILCANDYSLFKIDSLNESKNVGSFEIDDENGRITLKAKGVILPILINELIKGCIYILSANGLPSNKKIIDYVIDKSDYYQAKLWDIRSGGALWKKFCEIIPNEYKDLKHYLFADIIKLEPKEFFMVMKEVLANTKKGRKIIETILKRIKYDLDEKEFMNNNGDKFFDKFDFIN